MKSIRVNDLVSLIQNDEEIATLYLMFSDEIFNGKDEMIDALTANYEPYEVVTYSRPLANKIYIH